MTEGRPCRPTRSRPGAREAEDAVAAAPRKHRLPGPTGELNRLTTLPRPPVLCLGPAAKPPTEQARAVARPGRRRGAGPRRPSPQALVTCRRFGAVLWWGDEATGRALRRRWRTRRPDPAARHRPAGPRPRPPRAPRLHRHHRLRRQRRPARGRKQLDTAPGPCRHGPPPAPCAGLIRAGFTFWPEIPCGGPGAAQAPGCPRDRARDAAPEAPAPFRTAGTGARHGGCRRWAG